MSVIRKSLGLALVFVAIAAITMTDVRMYHLSQNIITTIIVVPALGGLFAAGHAYSDRKRQLRWGFWGFLAVVFFAMVAGLALSLKFH